MTLDQILAALAVIVPIAASTLGMHIQNLIRGDRLLRSVQELQSDFANHNRRVKKMRRRLAKLLKAGNNLPPGDKL